MIHTGDVDNSINGAAKTIAPSVAAVNSPDDRAFFSMAEHLEKFTNSPIFRKGDVQTAVRTPLLPTSSEQSKSQEVRREEKDHKDKKSLFETIKTGFERAASSAVADGYGSPSMDTEKGEEIVAKSLGAGPFFEAAMEIKEAVDSVRDESGPFGKIAKWTGLSKGENDDDGAIEAREGKPPREVAPAGNGVGEGTEPGLQSATGKKRDEKGRFIPASGGKPPTMPTAEVRRVEKPKSAIRETEMLGEEAEAQRGRQAEERHEAQKAQPEKQNAAASRRPATMPTAEASVLAVGDEAKEIISVLESLMNVAVKSQLLDKKYNDSLGVEAAKQASSAVIIENPESLTETIVNELQAIEREDVKRHGELIKAVLRMEKGRSGRRTGGRDDMPYPRKTGPGSRRRRGRRGRSLTERPQIPKVAGRTPRGGMPGGGGGMLTSLLSRFALPALALAGAGMAGYGAGSLINEGINKTGEAVTGQKDWTMGAAAHDFINPASKGTRQIIGDVESGRKGYSAYQNRDSGIVSAGKYQFTAQGGEKSSLAKVLDNYVGAGGYRTEEARRYSSVIKSGRAESLRNDAGFKSFIERTGGEKAMQQAQEKTFDQNYFNPAIGYAQKQGINAVKMPKLAAMMVDTKIQGGMEDVTQATSRRLSQQGKSFKTASEEEIMNIFVEERKSRLDRVAAAKEAKGDTKTASMLRNSKGRVDHVRAALDKNEESLRKDANDIAVAANKERGEAPVATVTPATPETAKTIPPPVAVATATKQRSRGKKTAIVTAKKVEKPAAKKKEELQTAVVDGETKQQAATTAEIMASPAATGLAKGAATSTTTVVKTPAEITDARKRIQAGNRERLAAAGAGSLAPKPVAAFVNSRPAPPERISASPVMTSPAGLSKAGTYAASPTTASQGGGMEAAIAPLMSAIAKLNATVTKIAGQKEATRQGEQQIKTEFDDTMLTLMAYDRV